MFRKYFFLTAKLFNGKCQKIDFLTKKCFKSGLENRKKNLTGYAYGLERKIKNGFGYITGY